MKSLITAALLALGLASTAQAAQPNLFTCKNTQEGLVVSYSSSSFQGNPHFNVTQQGKDVLAGAQGNNIVSISQDETSLGLLVTADVVRPFIADAPSLVYSVVIPGIELGNTAWNTTFETILIQGTNGGFMALPAVYQRINKTTKLKCTAQKVFF